MDDLVKATKVIRNLQGSEVEEVFANLGEYSNWLLLCFADTALGNLNNGVDSTASHIYILANKTSGESVTKRVVKSTLAAKVFGPLDGLDSRSRV